LEDATVDDPTPSRQQWLTSGEKPRAGIAVLETENGDRLGRCPINPGRWMWLVLYGEALPAECDDRCSEWRHLFFFDPLFLPARGLDLEPFVSALPDDAGVSTAAVDRLASLPDVQVTLRGEFTE
jgi:hypothetical protein